MAKGEFPMRDTRRAFITLLLAGVLSASLLVSATETAVSWPVRIPATYTPEAEPDTLSEAGVKQKATAEKLDTHDLLFTGKVVVDKSRRMLRPPATVAKHKGRKFTVANTAPRVEFGVIPATPRFFPTPVDDHHDAIWANWGQAAYYPAKDRFYCSVGDNGSRNAHLYVVEYDPAKKEMSMSPEINKVLGRDPAGFGEGKIHGHLDFVDGPNLWFATYWSKYPEPKPEDWATGYLGGHIMSYNVENQEFVDYGIPMPGASWPSARIDPKRRMLYAAGYYQEFLAWNMDTRKPIYAGHLPEGMLWANRVMMIDDVTGRLYTSNNHADETQRRLIRYDAATNRFTQLEAAMPADEIGEEHTVSVMRASTSKRGPDSLFYGITMNGQLFSFDPESETLTDRGYGWPGEERYTTSLARSPGGRYIYYCPGAHGHGCRDGSPLVQYDTKTGARKVIAFLAPFYMEKYGYTPSGTFSIKLDDAGERLFVCWNGGFFEKETALGEKRHSLFIHNALMLVHIPASERRE
jgi:hypothetical protein